MVEKLQRLKNEDFNRVLIPEFTYTVDGNDVTYNVEFIQRIWSWNLYTKICTDNCRRCKRS